MKNILLVKESNANETRIALLPQDIHILVTKGLNIYVESGAGNGVNIDDSDFKKAGATIRESKLQTLFENIDIIVRAKRANSDRELEELTSICPGTIIIGTLDPKEKDSNHLVKYKKAGLKAFSLDYLETEKGDPLNLLEKMSKLTGELALEDAITKSNKINKIVIIGYGIAGKSAYTKAQQLGYDITVFCTQKVDALAIKQDNNKAFLLDKSLDKLENNQRTILVEIMDADIVITSARSKLGAPLFITQEMLQQLKNIIIVDLAISDGGNVEGSKHDRDRVLENGVIISNVSGYPKKKPLVSSQLWSESSRLFLEKLIMGETPITASARVV